MPHSESPRPLTGGRPVAECRPAGAPFSASGTPEQITVAVTPGFHDHGSALLVLCHTIEERPRELRAALSGERAALWRTTIGQEMQDRLEQCRAEGQEVFQDMPLFTLRLRGVEGEREFTSQLGRLYRVRVFEVTGWSRVGGSLPRERLWH